MIGSCSDKTCLQCFRPGPKQTGLYRHERWLEAGNFGFRKKKDCTIHEEKMKMLISCSVTAQLICFFVFTYKSRFPYDATQSAFPIR